MLVHSVIGLTLLAGASFVLDLASASFGRIGPDLWALLLRASLVGVLLLSAPAIVTGIADRNSMYVSWHPSHRAKLVLSLVLVALSACVSIALLADQGRASAWIGAAVISNAAVVLALAAYGLRITLGRQSMARTSYVPDMMNDPPVDILEAIATAAAEEPKLIDPSEEDAA
jgi:hypothetical protein